MKEKQSKKIFTRMLMNNWGGISHKVMEFHEYVNLFSGKSGSGKSTVMDAIQVVLYGSISSTFLNKAADDAKNRRSVLSYLRGAQKDGSFNRTSVLRSSWRLRIQERIHILVLVFHLRLERQIQTSGNIVSSVIPERFRRMNI